VRTFYANKEDSEVWEQDVPLAEDVLKDITHWESVIGCSGAINDYISEVAIRYSTVSFKDMCKLIDSSSGKLCLLSIFFFKGEESNPHRLNPLIAT